mmetsp:Transcript_28650/g.48359  ORF Transcript_28650/g.48359 Transcript_28650/m.48359 type:complete len:99 (+) Transcript_28650:409-705(+)|eukprot:CAMPEP_0114438818 /NCGR_PEP_ID=MMETSP0103-20121206/14836_1 /TAXON_ID=37642 ORGANISM="Paraphysomonas imperforata, Strain PA2" /NCGR_SAMPLE_ID=MMETSP0103 /ASSEMBLY_ACC=CAM_ASM_000201 /LENGTH=98 /DNA_ID=CAMNT_0001609475 /DNA_START=323 /DNA_END=619 /DNA_ORIENTATION=-
MTRNRTSTYKGGKVSSAAASFVKKRSGGPSEERIGVKADTVFKTTHGFGDGLLGHGEGLPRGYPFRDTFQRRGYKKKKQLHVKPKGHVEHRASEKYAD